MNINIEQEFEAEMADISTNIGQYRPIKLIFSSIIALRATFQLIRSLIGLWDLKLVLGTSFGSDMRLFGCKMGLQPIYLPIMRISAPRPYNVACGHRRPPAFSMPPACIALRAI